MVKKLSPEAQEPTRREWRELEFFYTLSHNDKEWRLVGSASGLLKFADLLEAYASDERNNVPSEHAHFGPHAYLEVISSLSPGIDEHSIYGTLPDLLRLADLVRRALHAAAPGSVLRIREQYTPSAEYALVLDVREDSFDPASEDPQLD